MVELLRTRAIYCQRFLISPEGNLRRPYIVILNYDDQTREDMNNSEILLKYLHKNKIGDILLHGARECPP